MKDTQYFLGPPNSWNGGVMSGGGAPTEGRGVPWPPAHHPLPHAGHQLLGFLGAAPTAHLPWSSTSPKPPPASSGMDLSSRPPAGMDLSRARSPLPNGALNGSSTSVPSAATPKESVSVIAPNPLRPPLPLSEDNSMAVDDDEDDDEDEEDCMVIDAPPQPPAAHAMAGHLPPSSHGVPLSTHTPPSAHPPSSAHPPPSSIASTPAAPIPGLALPLTHQPLPYSSPQAVRPSSPPAAADPPLPPPPVSSTAHASAVIPSQPPPSSNHRPPFLSKAADNVESLLENLFQPQEEPPIPHPVIVPNSLRPPPLTEDKVVAMLEESVTPEKASPTLPVNCPTPSSTSTLPTSTSSGPTNSRTDPSQSSQTASEGPPSSSIPNVIPPPSSTVPNVVPPAPRPSSSGAPPSKVAAMSNPVTSAPAVQPAKPSQSSKTAAANTTNESTPETFLQVESELARMFAGIEEPSEEPPPPKVKLEVEPSPATQAPPATKTPARRRGRKPGERRGRPRLSSGPAREKRVVPPPPHKDGSSDGSVVGTRARGPFLRISGDRLCPTSVVLVNAARDDEEKDRSVDPSKRRVPKIVDGRVKGPGLYSSTLSSKYNSSTMDTSWTCAFCHKRSHCSGGLGGEAAGDLFGPYTVTLRPQEKVDGPSDTEVAGAQRLHGSRGRGQSLRAANAVNSLNHRPQKGGGVDEVDENREVWAHEQCIVWAPGIMMVGPHLVGLDDALSSSVRSKCTGCGEMGASIGCLEHGCKDLVHYGCAVASNWQLDEDTFHAHCPHHRKVKVLTLEMLKTGT